MYLTDWLFILQCNGMHLHLCINLPHLIFNTYITHVAHVNSISHREWISTVTRNFVDGNRRTVRKSGIRFVQAIRVTLSTSVKSARSYRHPVHDASRVLQFSRNFLLGENPPRSDYSVIAGEIVEAADSIRQHTSGLPRALYGSEAAISTPDDIR